VIIPQASGGCSVARGQALDHLSICVFRRSAQYFFIRTLVAFLAPADMPFRFPVDSPALSLAQRARCAAAIAWRPAAESFPRFFRGGAGPLAALVWDGRDFVASRDGNDLRIKLISA
jgi:hypothetical protein